MNSTTPQSMSDLPELPNELVRVGGLLSNAAYNLAQHADLSPEMRESLDKLRKQWDAARTEYGRLCRATAEQAGNYGHSAGCTSASADHPYSPVLSCCLGAEQAGKVEGWKDEEAQIDAALAASLDGHAAVDLLRGDDECQRHGMRIALRAVPAKPTQPAAPDDKPRMLTPEELADLHAKQRAIGPVSPIREVEAMPAGFRMQMETIHTYLQEAYRAGVEKIGLDELVAVSYALRTLAPVQASEARGAIGDDILGKLEDEKVFAIEVRGAMLHFYERCDEYFGVDLTTSEVRSLAAELTMLANKTDAMIAAHTQAGPVG